MTYSINFLGIAQLWELCQNKTQQSTEAFTEESKSLSCPKNGQGSGFVIKEVTFFIVV